MNELEEQIDPSMSDEDLAAIKQKTVTGATSYFLRTLLLQGIGFASLAVLSYFFSQEDFGTYGLVIQVIGILVFFSDIGLAAALIQKKGNPTLIEYRTAFTVQQILSWLIFAAILVVMATGVISNKTGPAGNWILLSLGISFPLATLKTIPSVILERKLNFSKLVYPQVIEQLFFHGILIYYAWSGSGVISYSYAIIARSIVGAAAMWRIQPWDIGLAISRDALRTLIGYGVKFQLNDFLARIKDQLFYFVLGGWLLPLNQFGLVQWAKTWSMYPYNLTVQNVMAITFPTFSRLQGQTQALSRAIEKSLFFITLIIFPILVGMSIFITPLLALVPSYQKWEPAVISLVFFALSIGWSAISTPLTNTLNALGKIDITLKLMVMWTVLTWVLTPLAISWYGYEGVAIAAFAIATTSVIPAWFVKKIVPISFVDQVWRQTLASIVMAAVGVAGFPFWKMSWPLFILGIGACGLVYVAVVVITGEKKLRHELASIGAKQMLNKVVNRLP